MSGVSVGVDESVLVNGRPISYGEILESFTQWQYDNQSSGHADENTGPSSASDYSLGPYNTQPLFDADGAMYYCTYDSEDTYTKEVDGSTEWTFQAGGNFFTGGIENGVLFALTGGDKLYAINTDDGSQKWTKEPPLGSGDKGRPLIVDGTVYIGNYEGVFAFNTSDGTVQWEFTTGAGFNPKPSWWDGTLVATDTEYNTLYGINAPDGSKLWEYTNEVTGTPAIMDGVAYVGRWSPGVSAINVSDGSIKWETGTSGVVEHGVAVHPDVVVTGDNDGYLYGFDPTDGTQLYSISKSGWHRTPPIVVDGIAHHVLGDTYHAVDIASGTVEYTVTANENVDTPFSPINGTMHAPEGSLF